MNTIIRRFAAAAAAVLTAWFTSSELFSCTGSMNTTGGSFYPDCEKYSVGDMSYEASEIKTLGIDWISGTVEVLRSENDTLSVTEQCEEGLGPQSRMHWRISDRHLDIRYCESGYTFTTSEQKRLTVEIPDGIDLRIAITSGSAALHEHSLKVLEATSTSGEISIGSVTADSILLSSTSGDINIEKVINSPNITVNTTSGDMKLGTITAEQFSFSSTSGDCSVIFDRCGNADFSSTSGNVKLSLNGNGASILHSSTSGKFIGSGYTVDGDRYIYGDGSCHVTAGSTSGDFTVTE